MNMRIALIVGSALVVLVVSVVAVEVVLWSLKPGRIEEISWWRIQSLTVWPATFSAAVVAAWCSGRREWQQLDSTNQAAYICAHSYIVYGLLTVALIFVENSSRSHDSTFNVLESVFWSFVSGGLMTFVGMVTTAIPVFIAEYAVIRFIRRHWQAVVSPEVVQ